MKTKLSALILTLSSLAITGTAIAEKRGDCRAGSYYPTPRIEVSKEKSTGNVMGDKVKIRGVIEGTCIKEAGYYEGGSLVENIPVSPDGEFKRFEFEVKGRADQERRGEIRAYNINGDRATYEVGESVRARPGDDIYRDQYRDDFRNTPQSPIDDAMRGLFDK